MHAPLTSDASMLSLIHDDFRMRRFARRCYILFNTHRIPISRCGALALESLDNPDPFSDEPGRAGEHTPTAWVALADVQRWIFFWNHLHRDDEALCKWSLDCIRLLCFDFELAPHASPHALASLSAYASLPCAVLSIELAKAIEHALHGVLFHHFTPSEPLLSPTEIDARLCHICLTLLARSKSPGAPLWLSRLVSNLPHYARSSHSSLFSLIERLELQTACDHGAHVLGGRWL